MRKFYKTVVTVTVLSEGECVFHSLADLERECIDGEWSFSWKTEAKELTAKAAAAALLAQGSDPELFQLGDEGEDLSDGGV